MSIASPAYQLFGFIGMTPMLWTFFLAQTALLLVALRLCLVPIKNARRGRRLIVANGLAVPLAFGISALSYSVGLFESFRATAAAQPNDKATILATGISNTIHVMWLWIPFAIVLSGLLVVQISRYRALGR